MIDLLWDLHQQRRIRDVEGSASDAARKAANLQDRLSFLEDRVDRLLLQNMALWSLLRERAGLTDQDLAGRMEEIDLQDGVADGKVSGAGAITCPRCQRKSSSRHQRCLYCGQELRARTPFDAP